MIVDLCTAFMALNIQALSRKSSELHAQFPCHDVVVFQQTCFRNILHQLKVLKELFLVQVGIFIFLV